MQLLLDENISHRILKYTDEYFADSRHVKGISEEALTDLAIWDYAAGHDYIIVTYDQDFYEWQQLKGFPPKIVWLRFGNASTKKIARKLIAHKSDIKQMVTDEHIGLLEIY